MGPLVKDAPAKKCDELVRGALEAGARALVGGSVPERTGWYYDPTVLVDVPAYAAILREEIFGQVAPIVTFTDEAGHPLRQAPTIRTVRMFSFPCQPQVRRPSGLPVQKTIR